MIKAQIIGLDRFKIQIEVASGELKRKIDAALSDAANEFAARAYADILRENSVFTGELKGSIEVEREKPLSYAVVTKAPHAGFVEFGTKDRYKKQDGFEKVASQYKGLKPGNQFGTLYDAILAWVKKKNIGQKQTGQYKFVTKSKGGVKYLKSKPRLSRKTKKEKESLAWAITMKIAKYGRKPKPFFFKQIGPVRKMLETNLKSILDNV